MPGRVDEVSAMLVPRRLNSRRSSSFSTPWRLLRWCTGNRCFSTPSGLSVYLCPFYVTPPHWNSVVGFSNVREQIEAADKGDLVHITGRMRETSHGEGNEIAYRTELIADTFSVLAKAGGEQ